MIQTGHGGPLGALALGVLVSLVLLLATATTATAQDPLGNVVTVAIPRPGGTEIGLVRFDVKMGRHAAGRNLAVRKVGGAVARGYAVAAVRARQRGTTVRVRLATIRSGAGARGPSMKLKLKIGGAGDAFRHTATRATAIRPGTGIWRRGDCSQINGEARSWKAVPGLANLTAGGERYSARTAVGAGWEAACQRDIDSVAEAPADDFRAEADPRFDVEGGGEIEGFYATWVKNADGSGKVCVYVRGDWGGSGDLSINGGRTPFTLDDTRGLARIDTNVAPGEYAFTVRWRQPDGSLRESGSSIRVPDGAVNGQGPPAPYDAAGPCSAA